MQGAPVAWIDESIAASPAAVEVRPSAIANRTPPSCSSTTRIGSARRASKQWNAPAPWVHGWWSSRARPSVPDRVRNLPAPRQAGGHRSGSTRGAGAHGLDDRAHRDRLRLPPRRAWSGPSPPKPSPSAEDIERVLWEARLVSGAAPKNALARGLHFLEKGRYDEARVALDEVTDADPLSIATARARLDVGVGEAAAAALRSSSRCARSRTDRDSPAGKSWILYLTRAHVGSPTTRRPWRSLRQSPKTSRRSALKRWPSWALRCPSSSVTTSRVSASRAPSSVRASESPRAESIALAFLGFALQRNDRADEARKFYEEGLVAGEKAERGHARHPALELGGVAQHEGRHRRRHPALRGRGGHGQALGRRSTTRQALLNLRTPISTSAACRARRPASRPSKNNVAAAAGDARAALRPQRGAARPVGADRRGRSGLRGQRGRLRSPGPRDGRGRGVARGRAGRHSVGHRIRLGSPGVARPRRARAGRQPRAPAPAKAGGRSGGHAGRGRIGRSPGAGRRPLGGARIGAAGVVLESAGVPRRAGRGGRAEHERAA